MYGNSSRIDQRAIRTRNRIASAVIRLGHQRGVDRLTVGDLSREAGISRSTFYSHFGSLEDYLSRSFANMVEGMARHGAAKAGPDDCQLLHVRFILDHVGRAPGYVAAVSRSRYRPQMLLAGERRLQRHVEARIEALRPQLPKLRRAALARFVAAGFIGLLRDWMEGGLQRPAAEVQAQFEEIAAAL